MRHDAGGAPHDLLAVIAGIQPRAVIHRRAVVVVAAQLWFGHEHRIGDDGRVGQMIAVPHKELRDGRLVAFRRPVAPEPSLLEMRCVDDEGIADELAGGEATERVRCPGGWVGPAVHPDHAMAFRHLRPPVDGDEPLRVRVALFPRAEVACRAHLVRRHVRVALMIPQRDA